jgi:hypothetical protein
MSPAVFCPGFSAVKSRLTRSGTGPARPSCPVNECRHGFGLAGLQVQLPHEAADELGTAPLAAADQRGAHAPATVFLVIRIEQGLDPDFQQLASFRGRTPRSRSPVMVSRGRNSQPFAHLHDSGSAARILPGRFVVLGGPERGLLGHRCSLRSTKPLFSGTRSPARTRGSGAPVRVSVPGREYPEFPRYLGDRRRFINHSLGGLLLKFRRIAFPLPGTCSRSFPGESYWIPCPGTMGHLRPRA